MGKMQRIKGHSFERYIANFFKPIFPDARRHLEFQSEEAEQGVDISNTGRYKIQCKKYKKYCSITKIEEINAKENDVPILITEGDRKRTVAVLYLDDLFELIKIKEGLNEIN